MSNQVIHQLTDEAYAELCYKASQYEDLKAKVEQMRDYFELLTHFDGTVKADYVLRVLDNAIKEQNDNV